MRWFKKNNYPDYWKAYRSYFDKPLNQNLQQTRFVVLDTETTGLDLHTDRVLSIGTVVVKNEHITVSDQLELYVEQTAFNSDTVKIHGLLKTGTLHKVTEAEAMKLFLNHIKNAVLVAHHAAFDIAMINACLKRLDLPKLKNHVIDTGHLHKKTIHNTNPQEHFSLDALAKHYNIPLHDRHTASGDAFITAILFIKLLASLKKTNPNLLLSDLLVSKPRIGLL